MKKYFPHTLLILIIGSLSYSSYVLRNSTDNAVIMDQFTRFLEKKKQQKENIANEERINELQRDIEEIVVSVEEYSELDDKLSNASYIIDISIILCVLALYLISKEISVKDAG